MSWVCKNGHNVNAQWQANQFCSKCRADVRRGNLGRLIGERFDSNVEALSRATSRAVSIYRSILSDPPVKGFGAKLARSIETELGLPSGWLDVSKAPVSLPAEELPDHVTPSGNDAAALKYHAPSGCLLLPSDALEKTAHNLRQAMRRIREATGLTLDRYEVPAQLSPADLAQQSLVTVARDLGIDLGAEWCNEIDLRDLVK